MKKKVMFSAITALFLMVTAVFAAVLTGSTFGEATALGNGSYTLVSDASPGFGGVNYTLPVPVNFSDIRTLQTQQTPESDDGCVTGSPRFQLNVDTDGDEEADANVFVYTYYAPDSCPGDSDDLAGTGGNGDIAGTYDTAQLVPGTQVSTYTATAALFAANPTWKITGIQLVIDSGYSFPDGEQTVTVVPTVEVIFGPPTTSGACKNGGWRVLTRADNSPFKNQGDCIQYVNTGK